MRNCQNNGKVKLELAVGHRPMVVGHLALFIILGKSYRKTRSKQHFERHHA